VDVLGDNVIKGVDWVLGGTSGTCRSNPTNPLSCTADEIKKAIIEIPTPQPINPNDATYLSTGVVTEPNTKKASVRTSATVLPGGTRHVADRWHRKCQRLQPRGAPCEVSIWNDDDPSTSTYSTRTRSSAVFTDVLFSPGMAIPPSPGRSATCRRR
jgi:hypothetical protein